MGIRFPGTGSPFKRFVTQRIGRLQTHLKTPPTTSFPCESVPVLTTAGTGRHVPRQIQRDERGEAVEISAADMLRYEDVNSTPELKHWLQQMPIVPNITATKQEGVGAFPTCFVCHCTYQGRSAGCLVRHPVSTDTYE